MKKLFLLYLVLVVGVLFELFPAWDGTFMTPDPFWLYDFPIIKGVQTGIALESYAYLIAEHLIKMIAFGLIAFEAYEYKRELWILFGLFVADLIDFLITYNSYWGRIHFKYFDVVVSMNTVSFAIFGLVILNAWIRNSFK